MWSQKSFIDVPDDNICELILKYVDNINNPNPDKINPKISNPNEIFFHSPFIPLPNDLSNMIHNKDNIISGYIEQIQCYWVSNGIKFFIFPFNGDFFNSFDSIEPIITIGYFFEYIIVSHQNSISLYSFPNLNPINIKYIIPNNVNITLFYNSIIGCSDGRLRNLILKKNNNEILIEIKGFSSLNLNDSIIKILKIKNYYITLSINNILSIFTIDTLKLINSIKLNSIISIWNFDLNIYLIDQNTFLFKLNIENPLNLNLIKINNFLKRNSYQNALWINGLFIGIDGIHSNFDRLTIVKYNPNNIYTIFNNFGNIFNFGILPTELSLFTSNGLTILSEKLINEENEQIWKLSILLSIIWNINLIDINFNSIIIQILKDYYFSNFKLLSNLSHYLLIILEDFNLISLTEFKNYFNNLKFKDFLINNIKLKNFFKLKKIYFEINLNNFKIEENSQISKLILESKSGNKSSEYQLVKLISTFNTNLPYSIPIFVDFLFQFGYYEELVENIYKWSNLIYSSEKTEEFEKILNNNLNYDINEFLSYHLKFRILNYLIPFLKLSILKSKEKPGEILIKLLNKFDKTFQKFIFKFFENEKFENLINFDYLNILNILKEIKSKHLSYFLEFKNYLEESFEEFLENSISNKFNLNIEERINLLNHCLLIKSNKINYEYCNNLLLISKIIKNYLIDNKLLPQNLFANNLNELINYFFKEKEFSILFQLIKINNNLNFKNYLIEFLNNYFNKEIFKIILIECQNNLYNFNEKDLIEILFEIKNFKEFFEILNNFNFNLNLLLNFLINLNNLILINNINEFLLILLKFNNFNNINLNNKISIKLSNIILELNSKNNLEIILNIKKYLKKFFIINKFNDNWDNLDK